MWRMDLLNHKRKKNIIFILDIITSQIDYRELIIYICIYILLKYFIYFISYVVYNFSSHHWITDVDNLMVIQLYRKAPSARDADFL